MGELTEAVNIEKKERTLFSGPTTVFLSFLPAILFPPVILTLYIHSSIPIQQNTSLFLISALSSALGGIGGWYILHRWWGEVQQQCLEELKKEGNGENYATLLESRNKLVDQLSHIQRGYEHQIDLLQSSAAKSKQEVLELNIEMDQKLEEIRHAYLEFEDLRQEYSRLEEEFSFYRKEEAKKQEHQNVVLHDYQKTIQEQRSILKKKQTYIDQLEAKVKELMYEIRSLLQIGESSSCTTPIELGSQEEITNYYLGKHKKVLFDLEARLDHYVYIAQEFTGADHLGHLTDTGPRFLDPIMSGFAIDLRRLFDCYKEESGVILLVYSLIEKKILFTNPFVKNVLGWSSERFSQDFTKLLSAEGYKLWQDAIQTVANRGACSTTFNLVHKNGRDLAVTCALKKISKGPFQNYAVGLLHAAAEKE